MQTPLFNTPRRVLGATLTALLVAASTLVSAPAAFAAPAPVASADSSADTVLVPRITKGSYGVSTRVKRDSPQAKRYFASVARSQAPKSANCPGTICPKTLTCYDTKGALGARCLTN